MGLSIGILFLLPWLDTSRVRSATFRPVFKWFYLLMVANMMLLGYVGSQPAEGIWIVIGQLSTAYYFIHFLVLLPFIGWFERPRPLPDSIAKPVLPGGPVPGVGAVRDKA
jgi:quinol-cytochrome oxidoreductase complex cytochrome b subunit